MTYKWTRRGFGLVTVAALSTTALSIPAAFADEVITVGISAPMSGAAATWGLGMEYTAKEAAKAINNAGGITVDGKKYTINIIAYDNKYNAAEGSKVAQTLLSRDNAQFVIGVGTAPVAALQSLTERKGVLLFSTAWGRDVKGPKFPLTFTQINTPNEVLVLLYPLVKEQNPAIKTVALLNPNDATGKEVAQAAKENWDKLGVKIVSTDWYERGATEFQPIAAKIAALKPDVVDLGASPPAEGGLALKELDVLGWKGVKVIGAGTSGEAVVKVAGPAAEQAYLGLAADYDGPQATEIQRALNKGARDVIREPLNVVQMGGYDAIMALKAGIEKAKSVDPKNVAKALPTAVIDTSYGKSVFGGEAIYGSPQQLQLPVIVTRVKDGRAVELKRVIPAELQKRLISN
jgi:branched-chain amino acid transport system substrate-binding protein